MTKVSCTLTTCFWNYANICFAPAIHIGYGEYGEECLTYDSETSKDSFGDILRRIQLIDEKAKKELPI